MAYEHPLAVLQPHELGTGKSSVLTIARPGASLRGETHGSRLDSCWHGARAMCFSSCGFPPVLRRFLLHFSSFRVVRGGVESLVLLTFVNLAYTGRVSDQNSVLPFPSLGATTSRPSDSFADPHDQTSAATGQPRHNVLDLLHFKRRGLSLRLRRTEGSETQLRRAGREAV